MVDAPTTQVAHPGTHKDMDKALEAAQLAARNGVLETLCTKLLHDLGTIYDAVRRREHVDLTYLDGEVITITRAKPRGEKDAA